MFGMSSEEFWEQDPQLYWAYRIFYIKKVEFEQQQTIENMKYNSWLNGNMNYIATSTSLNNAFSKQKTEYPKYDNVFEKEKKDKKLSKKETDKLVQDINNAWARY